MEYRVYLFSEDGHIGDVVALECADDKDAKRQAEQLLLDDRDIEVWQHDRKVAVLNAPADRWISRWWRRHPVQSA